MSYFINPSSCSIDPNINKNINLNAYTENDIKKIYIRKSTNSNGVKYEIGYTEWPVLRAVYHAFVQVFTSNSIKFETFENGLKYCEGVKGCLIESIRKNTEQNKAKDEEINSIGTKILATTKDEEPTQKETEPTRDFFIEQAAQSYDIKDIYKPPYSLNSDKMDDREIIQKIGIQRAKQGKDVVNELADYYGDKSNECIKELQNIVIARIIAGKSDSTKARAPETRINFSVLSGELEKMNIKTEKFINHEFIIKIINDVNDLTSGDIHSLFDHTTSVNPDDSIVVGLLNQKFSLMTKQGLGGEYKCWIEKEKENEYQEKGNYTAGLYIQ